MINSLPKNITVQSYRKALSPGGTVTLPDLYSTAGTNFAFDAETLQEACDLAANTILEHEQ